MRAGTVAAAATELPSQDALSKACPPPSSQAACPVPSAVAASALRVPGCTPRARKPEEEQPELSLLLAPRGAGRQEGAQRGGCWGQGRRRPGREAVRTLRPCVPERKIPRLLCSWIPDKPLRPPRHTLGQVGCLCPPLWKSWSPESGLASPRRGVDWV